MSGPYLSVVMPALNEARNIRAAMGNVLAALDDFGIDGELVVVSDGSTDATADLVREKMAADPRVRLLEHTRPHGVGASFWDGVQHARGQCVCMLPGDNENDPWELFRYIKLMDHVDILVPFVFNKEVRSLFRNALSFAYRFIINTTFLVYFNYTNGTVVYRRQLLLDELNFKSDGFFFQTDILIRLVKRGYLFAEVPYRLNVRSHGVSKAVTFPSLVKVVKGYLKLVREIHFPNRTQRDAARVFALSTASRTARRHEEVSPFVSS